MEGRRRKGRICGEKSDEDGCGGEEKEEYVGKIVMRMDVEGRRRKGSICGEKSDEDGCGGEEKERKNMWGKE